MGNRVSSVRGERAVGLFLDKYFYKELVNNNILLKYEREQGVADKEAQVTGTDIVLTYAADNSVVKCDEKARVTRLLMKDEKIDFPLEISFFSEKAGKGKLVDGWFVAEGNVTEQYVFVWIRKVKEEKLRDDRNIYYNRIVADDILEAEVVIISKKRIKEWLEKKGYTDKKIKQKASKMRENNKYEQKLGSVGVMRYSSYIEPEKPINLRVGENVLIDLCEGRYLINKDKVVEIPKCKKADIV